MFGENKDLLPYHPAIETNKKRPIFISLIFQSLIVCSLTELNEHLKHCQYPPSLGNVYIILHLY